MKSSQFLRRAGKSLEAHMGEVLDLLAKELDIKTMIVEDEEIEAVQIESTRTIDIDQFVQKIEPSREFTPPRVVNLMEALRASVDAEKKRAPAPSTRARRPAKTKATR